MFVLKHRLVELTTRHRQEVDIESERAKQSQSQLEKTQLARERAHKQRVKGLEEQVSMKSLGNGQKGSNITDSYQLCRYLFIVLKKVSRLMDTMDMTRRIFIF